MKKTDIVISFRRPKIVIGQSMTEEEEPHDLPANTGCHEAAAYSSQTFREHVGWIWKARRRMRAEMSERSIILYNVESRASCLARYGLLGQGNTGTVSLRERGKLQCQAHLPEGIKRRTKGKLVPSFPPGARVRSEAAEQSCKSCRSATKGCTTGKSSNAGIRSRNGTIKHAGEIFCLLLLCSGFRVGKTEDPFTYVDPSDPLFLGAPNVTYTGDTNVTIAFETKSDFESYRLVLYEPGWISNDNSLYERDLTLSMPLVASPKVLTPDDYTIFTPQYGLPLDKEYFQKHDFRARIIGMKPGFVGVSGFVGVVSCKTGVNRKYDNGTSEITTRCSSGVGITCSCAVETGDNGTRISDGKVVSDRFQAFVKASAPSAVGICDILDQTVGSPCDSLIWGTQQRESARVYFRPMKNWGIGDLLNPPSGTPFYYLIELSTTQDFSSGVAATKQVAGAKDDPTKKDGTEIESRTIHVGGLQAAVTYFARVAPYTFFRGEASNASSGQVVVGAPDAPVLAKPGALALSERFGVPSIEVVLSKPNNTGCGALRAVNILYYTLQVSTSGDFDTTSTKEITVPSENSAPSVAVTLGKAELPFLQFGIKVYIRATATSVFANSTNYSAVNVTLLVGPPDAPIIAKPGALAPSQTSYFPSIEVVLSKPNNTGFGELADVNISHYMLQVSTNESFDAGSWTEIRVPSQDSAPSVAVTLGKAELPFLQFGIVLYIRANASNGFLESNYSAVTVTRLVGPPDAPIIAKPGALAPSQTFFVPSIEVVLSKPNNTGAGAFAAVNISHYMLQVSTNESFDAGSWTEIRVPSPSAPSVAVTLGKAELPFLQFGIVLYIRANASNGFLESNYSAVTVTRLVGPPDAPIIAKPGALALSQTFLVPSIEVVLSKPNNTGAGAFAAVNISHYMLQVSTSEAFNAGSWTEIRVPSQDSAPPVAVTLGKAELPFLQFGIVLYIRANASNGFLESNYSAVTVTRLVGPPAAPIIAKPGALAPSQTSYFPSIEVVLSKPNNTGFGELADVNISHYMLQVSTNESFYAGSWTEIRVPSQDSAPSVAVTLGKAELPFLQFGIVLYIRANASNGFLESNYSAVTVTRLVGPPAAPIIAKPGALAPSQTFLVPSIEVVLSKPSNTGAGAFAAVNISHYMLQVSTSEAFNASSWTEIRVPSQDSAQSVAVTLGKAELPFLQFGIVLYIRANASNGFLESNYSAVTVTRLVGPPAAPIIARPGALALSQTFLVPSIEVVLSKPSNTGAGAFAAVNISHYMLQVSTSEAFNASSWTEIRVPSQDSAQSVAVTLGQDVLPFLQFGIVLYIRANASNGFLESNYSAVQVTLFACPNISQSSALYSGCRWLLTCGNADFIITNAVYDDRTYYETSFNVSAEFNPDAFGNAFLGNCSSSGTKCLGTQEVIIAFQAVFPATPQDGMLWHFGGGNESNYGAWMGIRESATAAPKFRVRAGNGENLTAGANQIYLDVDLMGFPNDGNAHEVVVQIGRPSTESWKLQVWIDGKHQGTSGSMSGSKWIYTGKDATGFASYGLKASSINDIPLGEPNIDWPGAPSTIISDLRIITQVPWNSTTTSLCLNSATLNGQWATGRSLSIPGSWDDYSFSCCAACPSNAIYTNGSSVDSCQCIAGYGGPNGGPCSPCPAGSYKGLIGPSPCILCAPGNYSGPGSSSCTQCMAGKFTPVAGSSNCSNCEAGTSSAAVGASSNSTCRTCEMGKASSEPGSSACFGCAEGYFTAANSTGCSICDRGHTKNESGGCVQCARGKFKSLTGDGNCSGCRVNTYSNVLGAAVDTTCQSCPNNSFSPAALGAGAITDCSCMVGYSGPDGGPCIACQMGKYKPTNGSSDCIFCPSGSYARPSLASTSCLACPPNASAPNGSTSNASCACRIGYYGANGVACTACPIGKFGNGAGPYLTASACNNCSGNMTTAAVGASGSTSCQCVAGYFGMSNSTVCIACNVGTYKDVIGSSSCANCSGNFTRTTVLSGSTSRSQCLCRPGFFSTTNCLSSSCPQCSMCNVGYYKPSIANVLCTPCGIGNASSNVNGSDTVSSCQCNAGYTRNDTRWSQSNIFQCVACAVGTYKPTPIGNQNCTACPANRSTTALGSTANASCVCATGYTGTSTCLACTRGKFKASVGSTACTGCPANMQTILAAAPSGTDCLCNAGWNGNWTNGTYIATSPCRRCDFGKYKNFIGNYLDGGITSCPNCPANSYSGYESDALTDCVCNAGYSGDYGGPCTACAEGKYKPEGLYTIVSNQSNQSSSCALCPLPPPLTGNCTGPPNSSVPCNSSVPLRNCRCPGVSHMSLCCSGPPNTPCVQCPTSSYSFPGSANLSACFCNAGYYEGTNGSPTDASPCLACSAGTYSATHKSTNCTTCPAASFSLAAASTCSLCPENSDAPNGTSSVTGCSCNAGYQGDNGAPCPACSQGKYKPISGDSLCINCSMGTYNPQQASTDNSSCLSCPSQSSSIAGSPGPSSCDCNAGFYLNFNYTNCGDNCILPTLPDSTYCSGCPAGTYQALIGARERAQCLDCPLGQSSRNISSSLEACVCQPGYYGPAGMACSPCPEGTFSTVTNSSDPASCVSCPVGSSSPASSSSITACTCSPGYYGAHVDGTSGITLTCYPCPRGTYNNLTDQKDHSSCFTCPMNTDSPAASILKTNCTCILGYYGTDGNDCQSCPQYTYKNFSGNYLKSEPWKDCYRCPRASWSPEGSASITHCTCEKGYTSSFCAPSYKCPASLFENALLLDGYNSKVTINQFGNLTSVDFAFGFSLQFASNNSLNLQEQNLISLTCKDTTPFRVYYRNNTYVFESNGSTSVVVENVNASDYLTWTHWVLGFDLTNMEFSIFRNGMLTKTSAIRTNLTCSSALSLGTTWATLPRTVTANTSTCESLGQSSRTCARFVALVLGNPVKFAGLFMTHKNLARSCGMYRDQACNATTWSPDIVTSATSTVDGNTNADLGTNCTPIQGDGSWWRLDFGRQVLVTGLRAYYIYESSVPVSTKAQVYLGNDNTQPAANMPCATNQSVEQDVTYTCAHAPYSYVTGQYLYIQLTGGNGILNLCELQVHGSVPDPAASVGSATLPSYSASGGPLGYGHVSFDRGQSQYLEAGPRVLDVASNGGLTIVAVVRFTGIPGSNERIIEFGNGPNDNILLGRYATTDQLWLSLFEGSTSVFEWQGGQIVQDTWMTVVVRLRYIDAVNTVVDIRVNDSVVGTQNFSQALSDKTMQNTSIGKNLTGDVAGVFAVDEYLGIDLVKAVADGMRHGEDLTKRFTTTILNLARSCGVDRNQACQATAVSVALGGVAARAIDGNTDTHMGVCTQTASSNNPWWRVDFEKRVRVTGLRVYNRAGTSEQLQKLQSFNVYVGDYDTVEETSADLSTACVINQSAPVDAPYYSDYTCAAPLIGQYLYIQIPGDNKILNVCEVQVSGVDMVSSVTARIDDFVLFKKYLSSQEVSVLSSTQGRKITADSALMAVYDFNGIGASEVVNAKTSSILAMRSGRASISIGLGRWGDLACDNICTADYQGPNGLDCEECQGGTFKDRNGTFRCSACPDDSFSIPASPRNDFCKCNAGYTGPDGQNCSWCLRGQYKNTSGPHNCTVCPANTYSNVASALLKNCTCNTGYYGKDGHRCLSCPQFTYKNFTGNVDASEPLRDCVLCPAYSWSPEASTRVNNCTCEKGYTAGICRSTYSCNASLFDSNQSLAACTQVCTSDYLGPDGLECEACPGGTYKDRNGTLRCSDCLPQSYSKPASPQNYFCKCNSGYSGPDGGNCTACAIATYKPASGSQACSNCPNNSFTYQRASTNITNCTCVLGHFPSVAGAFGVACVACFPGSYKNSTGTAECTQCPSNSFTVTDKCLSTDDYKERQNCDYVAWTRYPAVEAQIDPAAPVAAPRKGTVNLTDCRCEPGYTGDVTIGSCAPCPVAKYKEKYGATACTPCQNCTEGFSNCTVRYRGGCDACKNGPDNSLYLGPGVVRPELRPIPNEFYNITTAVNAPSLAWQTPFNCMEVLVFAWGLKRRSLSYKCFKTWDEPGSCPYQCAAGFRANGSTAVPPFTAKPYDTFQPYSYTACLECNVSFCEVGNYRIPCNITQATYCQPCTNSMPPNAHYTSAGFPATQNNCSWGCNKGYYKNSAGACLPCTNVIPSLANYSGPGAVMDLPFCPWACPTLFYANGMKCEQLNASCPHGTCPYPKAVVNVNTADQYYVMLNNPCYEWEYAECNGGNLTCAACEGISVVSQSGWVLRSYADCQVGFYRAPCLNRCVFPDAGNVRGQCVECTNALTLNVEYTSAGNPYNMNNCTWVCKSGSRKQTVNGREQCVLI